MILLIIKFRARAGEGEYAWVGQSQKVFDPTRDNVELNCDNGGEPFFFVLRRIEVSKRPRALTFEPSLFNRGLKDGGQRPLADASFISSFISF